MNILLLNGGKAFAHSHGKLNHTLHETARTTLTAMGHQVRETIINQGYDTTTEVENFFMDGCRNLANACLVDG